MPDQKLYETEEAKHVQPPIPTFKKIHVVINPVSGLDHGTSPVEAVRKLLEDAGMEFEISITEKSGDAVRFTQDAIKAGADVIGVYGGDGTVMEVARGVLGTSVPMAIFPGGTANVMSVELGISQDLAEAIALIMGNERNIRAVDMACLNGEHYFLLRAGIGLEAEMTLTVEREEKRRLGKLAYIRKAIQSLWKTRPVRYRFVLDGKKRVHRWGVSCMICNSANIGIPKVDIAPNISVSDGWLDVIVVRGTDIRSLIDVAVSTIKSVLPIRRDVEPLDHWKAREVTVYVSRKQMVGIDGEAVELQFPLTAKIMPGAINVVVPGIPKPTPDTLARDPMQQAK